MKDLERKINEYCKKYGYKKIRRVGLGTFAECFYLGLAPNKNDYTEFDEVVQVFGLTIEDTIIWEKIWNQIAKCETVGGTK